MRAHTTLTIDGDAIAANTRAIAAATASEVMAVVKADGSRIRSSSNCSSRRRSRAAIRTASGELRAPSPGR